LKSKIKMGMARALFQSLAYPTEVSAMLKLKFGGTVKKRYKEPLDKLASKLSDLDFCYATLNKVSRSFAVVIQQLPEELKDAVCIFYLVLRGLDSVEDDMDFKQDDKLPLLREFHDKLQEDGWNIEGVGDSVDYRVLLRHFEKVIREYKKLNPAYQAVIKDITKRMGAGMADFVVKTQMKSIDSVADYNLYCHYVAGLVGHGLCSLFAASGLEDGGDFNLNLANSMGLFLQKTNIIRDYLEDLLEGRTWWPQEIWSQYGGELAHFKKNPDAPESIACLNAMVLDALRLAPEALAYMRSLKNPAVFRFCAIPQVMAIATLAKVYNNPEVFKRAGVKVRKGLSAKFMMETATMQQVDHIFNTCASQIESLVPNEDPNAQKTLQILAEVQNVAPRGGCISRQGTGAVHNLAWVMFVLGIFAALGAVPEPLLAVFGGVTPDLTLPGLGLAVVAAGVLGGFISDAIPVHRR
jgi:farnesyl-diphosphate farnesyltransferase